MLWYQYRQVQGRQNRLPLADSGGEHVSKEPRMAKMAVLTKFEERSTRP